MNAENLKKGDLLIAVPSTLGDVSFNRSVVLLAEHNAYGSVGFILNKPMRYTIQDLVPEIHVNFKIYNGGPVEQDNLYFIHNIPDIIPDSIEISNGIYWGGDFESTKILLNEGKINKNQIRFFLGYTGWDVNQLNEEVASNFWIMAQNIYKEKVIEKSNSDLWKQKMQELGGDYLLWLNTPENPLLN